MSLFFDYFRNTLRFPLIWKDGVLARLVKGAALTLDKAREDVLAVRPQAMPETCDLEYLVRLGDGRGVQQWPTELNDFFRTRVSSAYDFFMLGGKRAGLAEIIRRAGAKVEIVEPRDVKAKLDLLDNSVLDGSWHIDGVTDLKTTSSMVGVPHLNWAEFAVRINLAEMQAEWLHNFVKRLVYEYKPARSMPKFIYYLQFAVNPVSVTLDTSNTVHLPAKCQPMACATKLDGSWQMGRAAELLALDGQWQLDSFFKLGQVLMPVTAYKRIADCRLRTKAWAGSLAHIQAGGAEINTVPDFKLALKPAPIQCQKLSGVWQLDGAKALCVDFRLDRSRKVDGKWQLPGGQKLTAAWRLDGSWMVNESWMPVERQSGKNKLNGYLKIGPRSPQSNTWPQSRGCAYHGGSFAQISAISETLNTDMAAHNYAAIQVGSADWTEGLPYHQLALKPLIQTEAVAVDSSWKLNGSLSLAAALQLGRSRQVDGAWQLDWMDSSLTPREAVNKLDGSWYVGTMPPVTGSWPKIRGENQWQ